MYYTNSNGAHIIHTNAVTRLILLKLLAHTFYVEGLKMEKACELKVKSLVWGIWRLRELEGEQSTGGCVTLKTVTEIRLKCLIISESFQAMPIKFAVKIVWLVNLFSVWWPWPLLKVTTDWSWWFLNWQFNGNISWIIFKLQDLSLASKQTYAWHIYNICIYIIYIYIYTCANFDDPQHQKKAVIVLKLSSYKSCSLSYLISESFGQESDALHVPVQLL